MLTLKQDRRATNHKKWLVGFLLLLDGLQLYLIMPEKLPLFACVPIMIIIRIKRRQTPRHRSVT